MTLKKQKKHHRCDVLLIGAELTGVAPQVYLYTSVPVLEGARGAQMFELVVTLEETNASSPPETKPLPPMRRELVGRSVHPQKINTLSDLRCLHLVHEEDEVAFSSTEIGREGDDAFFATMEAAEVIHPFDAEWEMKFKGNEYSELSWSLKHDRVHARLDVAFRASRIVPPYRIGGHGIPLHEFELFDQLLC